MKNIVELETDNTLKITIENDEVKIELGEMSNTPFYQSIEMTTAELETLINKLKKYI